ncbi:MAG: cyclase family protein [Lentimicrobiaceae bacterium]|jgi:kynurenine formamidase|nr:cyclase family protein [Lentimicrobiaceae bacterium]
MKKIQFIFLILIVFVGWGCCHQQSPADILSAGRWVDLTHDFDENAIYWPTNIPFSHDTVFEGMTEKGYYYSSFKFSAEEHGGTHFDAPLHFGKGKNSIEKVPLQQLIGNAVVIDVKRKVTQNRDYQVSTDDFFLWEKENGKIPEGAIVLVNTGFSKYWSDKEKYTGTNLSGQKAVALLHFPGLHPDAALWLAEQRKIKAFGLDTPSIDYGQSKDFMVHRTLFAHGITAYENVASLDSLPAKGAYIIALPMKIKGGSGAPLRIVACF